jgi:hypothetical protein
MPRMPKPSEMPQRPRSLWVKGGGVGVTGRRNPAALSFAAGRRIASETPRRSREGTDAAAWIIKAANALRRGPEPIATPA